MRALPIAALCAAVVMLGGCGGVAAPGASAPAGSGAAPDAYLQAEGVVFDPVAGDVEDTSVCDGLPGRAELEVFDRASWPALSIAAGDAVLTCGRADGSGWRHIADGHTGDFGELAALVDSSWEDVAWFAIARALEAPTRVEWYSDTIANYDVEVEYVEGGRVAASWMVTVGVGLRDGSSGHIVTSFPDDTY